jgi:hypothetical protein
VASCHAHRKHYPNLASECFYPPTSRSPAFLASLRNQSCIPSSVQRSPNPCRSMSVPTSMSISVSMAAIILWSTFNTAVLFDSFHRARSSCPPFSWSPLRCYNQQLAVRVSPGPCHVECGDRPVGSESRLVSQRHGRSEQLMGAIFCTNSN